MDSILETLLACVMVADSLFPKEKTTRYSPCCLSLFFLLGIVHITNSLMSKIFVW